MSQAKIVTARGNGTDIWTEQEFQQCIADFKAGGAVPAPALVPVPVAAHSTKPQKVIMKAATLTARPAPHTANRTPQTAHRTPQTHASFCAGNHVLFGKLKTQ